MFPFFFHLFLSACLSTYLSWGKEQVQGMEEALSGPLRVRSIDVTLKEANAPII